MITDIRLQRFRSYRDESFEFDNGVNIIVGANASGKTNLLEALLITAKGSSFRAKDTELIARGAPWARLDAHTPNGLRTTKLLKQEDEAVRKEYEINEQKLKRLVLGKRLPFVLFEPNHLLLLQGSPDLRRDFIDTLLEQLIPGYSQLLKDYKRALSQRNALLKTMNGKNHQLFVWDVKLSQLGGGIAAHRIELIRRINTRLSKIYKTLAGNRCTTVTLVYDTVCKLDNYASDMLKQLEHRHHKDIERGFTSVGPHRDDMIVLFNNKPASETASRGETRTTLLALKILELELVEENREQKPILLLDDVFSELDGARRQALTEAIRDHQTFITTTDADVVVQHFMDKCRIIPL